MALFMSSCEAVEYAARTYGVGSLESMNDAPGISNTYHIMSEESRDQKKKTRGIRNQQTFSLCWPFSLPPYLWSTKLNPQCQVVSSIQTFLREVWPQEWGKGVALKEQRSSANNRRSVTCSTLRVHVTKRCYYEVNIIDILHQSKK